MDDGIRRIASAVFIVENMQVLTRAGLIDATQRVDPLDVAEAALVCEFQFHDGDGTDDDPPILVRELAAHGLTGAVGRVEDVMFKHVRAAVMRAKAASAR